MTDTSRTTDGSGREAPAVSPLTAIGSDDAGYCVDGVCVLPEPTPADDDAGR